MSLAEGFALLVVAAVIVVWGVGYQFKGLGGRKKPQDPDREG